MTHFKAFVFRLDVVFQHPFAEGTHDGHRVLEHIVPEIASPAVERGHFREQFGRLQAFFGRHAYRPAGGRDQNHVRASLVNGIDALLEASLALGRSPVVFPHMQMHDGRSGVHRRFGFANDFFHGIRNSGILFLGHFRAADGRCDYQFVHITSSGSFWGLHKYR